MTIATVNGAVSLSVISSSMLSLNPLLTALWKNSDLGAMMFLWTLKLTDPQRIVKSEYFPVSRSSIVSARLRADIVVVDGGCVCRGILLVGDLELMLHTRILCFKVSATEPSEVVAVLTDYLFDGEGWRKMWQEFV